MSILIVTCLVRRAWYPGSSGAVDPTLVSHLLLHLLKPLLDDGYLLLEAGVIVLLLDAVQIARELLLYVPITSLPGLDLSGAQVVEIIQTLNTHQGHENIQSFNDRWITFYHITS